MRNKKCDCVKGMRTCDRCNGKGDNRDILARAGLPETMIESCGWCRGEGTVHCRVCNGLGWVDSPEPQNSIERWELHTAWIKVIVGVVATQNRKNAPTKRLATAIEKAFNDDKIGVYWYPDRYGSYEIVITRHDNIHFTVDDKLSLTWGKGIGHERTPAECEILDHPSWSNLDEELQREDCSDYLERIEQERRAQSALREIDQRIAELEVMIGMLRGDAKAILLDLPIPESATIRADKVHWDHPTIYAKTEFSHIWPSKK